MTKKNDKPTLGKRFVVWLLPIVAGFIMKRIMKRLGASARTPEQEKRKRKYVKNKAD